MAEYKQYITQIQENGNVMISEDVIATIVENTLTEVDGVVKGGADVVGKKSWGKGIRIAIAEDNSLTIGCNIIVGYGENTDKEIANVIEYYLDNDYINKLINKQSNLEEVDTVSGATISSTALKKMVINTLEDYEENYGK